MEWNALRRNGVRLARRPAELRVTERQPAGSRAAGNAAPSGHDDFYIDIYIFIVSASSPRHGAEGDIL